MSALLSSILAACDYLEQRGVELPDEVKQLRRRDKREPGKRRKEEAEAALMAVILKRFRKQRRKIQERLEMYYPDRKAIQIPTWLEDIFDEDPEDLQELIRQLIKAIQGGVTLFNEQSSVGIDYTLINADAAEWARKHAGEIYRQMDETSKAAINRAITGFIEQPGTTIRDVVDLLPFNESRALQVAVTEITRAYAEGEMQAGRALAEEFPGLKVVKIWYTNNDDRVCPICGPLDGKQVELMEGFGVGEGEEGLMNPPAHPNCRCWITTTTDIEAS